MKENLTAKNRFKNNLLLVLISALTLKHFALCCGESLRYDIFVSTPLYKSSTFSCDILKDFFCCCEFLKRTFRFSGQPCGSSLAPFHKQSDVLLCNHLFPSKHFLYTANKLLIIKLQESPEKSILNLKWLRPKNVILQKRHQKPRTRTAGKMNLSTAN